jgi:hypothetical protein
MMFRQLASLLLGATLVALATSAMAAPLADKPEQPTIKDGIQGKIKSVNVAERKLTIVTNDGRERTFTVSADTIMLGPRGGKVRRHLHDPRFQEGMPLTIVADGNEATEIHLGYDREAAEGEEKQAATEGASKSKEHPSTTSPAHTAERTATKTAPSREAIPSAAGSSDQEAFAGRVKSFDARRRMLVLTLENGSNKAFLLSAAVPVHVAGAPSKQGLHDPALKEDAMVVVVTEPGGRKAKEIDVKEAMAGKPQTHSSAKVPASDEDEEEFPGHIKSMDPARRLLVVTLLNGKDRSFMLSNNVEVMVKGAMSKEGIHDEALKNGAPVTVITEPGGRKVKEVKLEAVRRRRAG